MYNAADFRVQNGRTGGNTRRSQFQQAEQNFHQNEVSEARGYPNSSTQFEARRGLNRRPVPSQQVRVEQQPVQQYPQRTRFEVQGGRRHQPDGSQFIQSHRPTRQFQSQHMVQADRNPHQAGLKPTYKFGGGGDGLRGDGSGTCNPGGNVGDNGLQGNVPDPNKKDHVLICHYDQGGAPHTISINKNGVSAHKHHCGDYDGVCAGQPPPPPGPCNPNLVGDFPDPDHPGKVLICHIPPGNPNNPQTLSIDPSGISGHQNDCDDYDGPCLPPPPPPPNCTFGAPDCNGVCGGPSVRDCKGICFDPTKTMPPNTVDCAGVCGGTSEYDCAGTCFDPRKGPPPHIKDCKGVCNGTSVPDCHGVCGGTAVPDCKGVCGGNAVQDCKGVCGGTATVDCKGICGGTAVRDCNGVCEGNAFKDCNGRCITPDCTFDNGQKPHSFRQPVQNSRPRQRFSPKNE